MARTRVTMQQHHRRWGVGIAVIVCVTAGAIAVMQFAHEGKVDKQPWGYVALAVAILSALIGLVMSFAQAAYESQDEG